MSTSSVSGEKSPVDVAYPVRDEASEFGTSRHAIYIDPEKEKAAFKKFDRYVVPVSLIFMLLCALDRNNVSEVDLYVIC